MRARRRKLRYLPFINNLFTKKNKNENNLYAEKIYFELFVKNSFMAAKIFT